jgi:pyruvate,water dikinase
MSARALDEEETAMSQPPGERSFPLPSQIADVPGAEGWQSMYPYFSRFQPEDDERFWFYNAMHFPEVVPAFDGITSEIPYTAIGANTARLFCFPTTMGIEYRILNGRVYITANPVSDPAQIEARLAHFQERAGHYYANWDQLYAGWQQRIEALIAEIEAVEVPELRELDDLSVVTGARGYASNHLLRENFHRCIDLYSKMWHHHTEFLMLGYGAYVVFFGFCKQAFPEIGDQMVARMVAGMDVTMYRPDDELKKLAALAVELDLADVFVEGSEPAKVLAALGERGDAGVRWLAALEQAKDPWFHVSVGDGFYHHHLSWADDLTVPFAALPRYVQQIGAGADLTRPTERLAEERERIANEYRALLANEDEQTAFDQMLGLCRQVFPYIESHKFYCEHWFTTRFFQKIRAFGRLLADRGVLADAEDVFHLRHTEVEDALADVQLAWASGGTESGARHWQPIIVDRKRIVAALSGWSPPPALGPVPEALNDPAVQMLWGVTDETVQTWLGGDELDENVVRGYAASPGVVEGVARVLSNVNEIGQMREGEILVCPVTAPSWGPVFGKIAAAVSDIGGTMSHAAIVAREYGMPAVVGTGQATSRIKTGDHLRVDGDRGIITILG